MAGLENELAVLDGGPFKAQPSVYAYLKNGMSINPHAAAVITMRQPAALGTPTSNISMAGDESSQWTFEELQARACSLAVGLKLKGLRSGDTVVTFIANGMDSSSVLWLSGVMKLTLVSLDPGMLLSIARRAELESYMMRMKPAAVLLPTFESFQKLENVYSGTNQDLPLVVTQADADEDCSVSDKCFSVSQLAKLGQADTVSHATLLQDALVDDLDRLAAIFFTSGTSSGSPKGCPRHVGAVVCNLSAKPDTSWAKDHILASSPWDIARSPSGHPPRVLATTVNFRIINPTGSLVTWALGGAVINPPPAPGGGFNVAGVLDAIEQHGVTTMVLIPVMLHMLQSHPSFTSRNLSSVTAVLLTGDIVTKDLLVKARAAFPNALISVAHGMSEVAGVITWPFADTPIEELPYFGNICPLGKPVAGVRVLVRDPETGRTLRRGEHGELCFSSDVVIKRYLDGVGADSFITDVEGRRWLRTGDMGMIDRQGIVFILGRIKDIIKRAGLSITPAALESCIASYTGATTCVVAVAHAELGQEPYAVVSDLNGKTVDQVSAHVLEMFGRDYALAGVAQLSALGLESFPLNASGKIVKYEVEGRVNECRSGP